jgi:hypothetical protein
MQLPRDRRQFEAGKRVNQRSDRSLDRDRLLGPAAECPINVDLPGADINVETRILAEIECA